MNITVKEVSSENKSKQEIESELLKKHDEKFNDTTIPTTESVNVVQEPIKEEVKEEIKEETPLAELKDEDVLSYIKNRYDKDISSVDELFAQTKDNDDLPEDVSAYLEYKKETGRGIADFYNLQKDFESLPEEDLLAEYYSNVEEGLDSEDIQDLIEHKFSYDEEVDEERDIKRIKLAKKRELVKAKKFFTEQKDKYKVPLESSGNGLSKNEVENLDAYRGYLEESKTANESQQKRYDWFMKKTDEVFSNEFKGFEFNVGESNVTFKPGDASELKNLQSDVNNFVKKFVDDKGLMKDAKGYHKALSMAMNPDKFAQFFYDQGVSAAVDNVTKKSKNINMDVRNTPQNVSKQGAGIRAVGDTSSGKGLKIRSIKRI
mgnify:FL=1